MKSARSVEMVVFILVPLSDMFELKSLSVILFYSLRTNLEFVFTLTEQFLTSSAISKPKSTAINNLITS